LHVVLLNALTVAKLRQGLLVRWQALDRQPCGTTVEIAAIRADVSWYYPDPKPAARKIKGYVAFWRGVEIEQ
jgi:hypothetical protein